MTFFRTETIGQTSTNSYASLLKTKVPMSRPSITVTLENSHASNVISYKILVTNDPEGTSGWGEEKSEADIAAANGTAKHALSGAFAWVNVQIKSKVADTHGTGNAWLLAVGV